MRMLKDVRAEIAAWERKAAEAKQVLDDLPLARAAIVKQIEIWRSGIVERERVLTEWPTHVAATQQRWGSAARQLDILRREEFALNNKQQLRRKRDDLREELRAIEAELAAKGGAR